ncbi:translational GTPase TypA [Desulfoluna spongiiphila]|uniref:Large ribosomal subunit assembly factor BipA n=1 Tax=Desulfoluna spongiiphila TaxID=419481 RepID=A0A1G5D9I4_9BACT|nr:translational GTPase TypA [Desulfoluna spongiiphila]SCY11191.1 GTP-binding protein [Desulfoluna spongiiphila]VVS95264.1 gtp-binding protein typa [Desulfoluna spongiiphila]
MTVCNTIRNIAIIAHVDHGKTTLVDAMFRQSGLFREDQEVEDRLMDSMDLERERGITISAKNCSVNWGGTRINILDTPGHADFSGEVERALSMVDGAILLVDASEGPLPQTRFVLKKTLEAGLKVIVAINKIDRADARPDEVLDEIYDLFIDLDATDEQLDFPVLYAIGRDGIAQETLEEKGTDLTPLFTKIVNDLPAPEIDSEKPLQILISDLGYSDYLGRLAIGRVFNRPLSTKTPLVYINEEGKPVRIKVTKVQVYDGLTISEAETVAAGDIAVISGIEEIQIGDTVCEMDNAVALPRVTVDEPTVAMRFTINTSPLAGQEGKIVQSSKILDRLQKESMKNVSMKVDLTEDRECFMVKGRGEFQMAILIETMRREGFELCVGRPEVIFKEEDGVRTEPIENVYVDCDENFMGVITEKLSLRKGKLINLTNNGRGRVNMEFSIPSRSLIGYRDEFLTDTKGTGIMNSIFQGYEPYRGSFPTRYTGSIVCDRKGQSVPYALFNLEPRGRMIIPPSVPVYEGMIIGEHNKEGDINVNACKEKKLSNMRASGKDENTVCSPVKPLTLEQAINFIRDDEMVEITPVSIRLRKTILSQQMRYQMRPKKDV